MCIYIIAATGQGTAVAHGTFNRVEKELREGAHTHTHIYICIASIVSGRPPRHCGGYQQTKAASKYGTIYARADRAKWDVRERKSRYMAAMSLPLHIAVDEQSSLGNGISQKTNPDLWPAAGATVCCWTTVWSMGLGLTFDDE